MYRRSCGCSGRSRCPRFPGRAICARPAAVTLPALPGSPERLIGSWDEQPYAPSMTLRPYEAAVYRFAAQG